MAAIGDDRYRAYLARYGITEPGERLLAFVPLDIGGARFFGYADAGGVRMKAAVTDSGVLAGGDEPAGDWYGLLAAMPDAPTAAARLAWLRTDEAATAHGLPPAPVRALADPALDRNGRRIVLGCLLQAGRGVERWRVTARPGGPDVIERHDEA